MQVPKNILLFSIDFEDIRFLVPHGMKYRQSVPQMTAQFLEFLQERKSKATFFVVGNTVALYSSLLKEIIAEGHEIGCHTHTHVPLDQHIKGSFRDDMRRNLDALNNIGAKNIYGFRAPGLSITEKTQWAYEVLVELGFRYSSSVMATDSAFHGWPEFREEFKKVTTQLPSNAGVIWELPPTLLSNRYFNVPFASSIYFRFLPWFITKRAFQKKFKQGLPVISYFHPFDLDYEQEKFMHPGVNENRIYNFLMRYNRKGMLQKLKKSLPEDYTIMPHYEYLQRYLEKEAIEKVILQETVIV
jgi:polysaccharide deacetylase family protein (PEP-CTERM system associated)